MAPAHSVSTQQLVEFLAFVSTAVDEQTAARNAAECAAQLLEAEFAAVVVNGRVVTTVGFPRGRAPLNEILRAVGMMRSSIEVQGVGPCMTTVGRVLKECALSLLVARLPGEGFTVEEANLVSGMGAALDLTMGMIRTLQAERELHERSKQQARENAELLQSLQDRQHLLEELSLIQRAISRHDPLAVIFEMIVSAAQDLMGGGNVDLRLQSRGDTMPKPTDAMAKTTSSDSLVETTDRSGRAFAAPIHEGLATVGALRFAAAPERGDLDGDDEALLIALADHVSLALSDARTVEQMRLAMHDSLTGLASRPLFLEKLAQRLEDVADQSGQVAVLFVDLDRFKLINDTAGHSTGDRLLAEVGRRISHSLRGSDVAARFGGDEFAVLLSGRKCLPWAIAVADRLLADLSAPFSIDDRQLYTGASIGIAVSCGPVSAEDLMRDADVAMYQAKQKGRGRYSVFQPDMRMWFFNRVQLESELRHALDASQLLLHYQPVVSLEQGTIVGAEALLRWQHPKRGLVPPLDFIPLAEEAGLMTVIGAWVLDEACREAVRWQHLGTPQFISVNVSAGQVHKGTLADDVARALAKSGLPPGLLTLEFTESLPLMDDTATRGRLQHLKELGVKLAIDDFGTGYSSLSYLRRLPLDYLKIDRSLINDVGTDAGASNLAPAVVRLGHTMGLAVVAEGVEGQSQADTLRQAGCELGQGYLFARPMPAYAFAELLSSPAALPDLAAIEVGTLTRSAPIP